MGRRPRRARGRPRVRGRPGWARADRGRLRPSRGRRRRCTSATGGSTEPPAGRCGRARRRARARGIVRRAVRIGVAAEIKPDEYRVALTPAGALELFSSGHEVTVETGAGTGSAFADAAYERSARGSPRSTRSGSSSDLLLKVKEPVAAEYGRLRDGLTLFTYLHIAADEPLTRALVDSGVTAVAYETVETARGALPLLAPMSEVAGRLAVPGGRVLPREAVRRPRAAARRRARRRARARRDHRRRDRRLQRRDHGARARRAGDDPRALDRPDAPPRGDPLGPGDAADVLDASRSPPPSPTPTS